MRGGSIGAAPGFALAALALLLGPHASCGAEAGEACAACAAGAAGEARVAGTAGASGAACAEAGAGGVEAGVCAEGPAESPPVEGPAAGCGCGALRRGESAGAEPPGQWPLEEDAGLAVAGETEEEAAVVHLEGGRFVMGLVPEDEGDPTVSPEDGEAPRRTAAPGAFGIGAFEVSNRRFARFVAATGYITEAERFGWSFGVEAFITPEVSATIASQVDAAPWWLPVPGADWRRPNGPGTSVEDLMDHPVTQVSLADAQAFCRWSRPGGRLPTEEEWEFAARGGRDQRRYPWGHRLSGPGGRHRMNIWQSPLDAGLVAEDGRPRSLYGSREAAELIREYYGSPNAKLDGFAATAPVDAYGPQNNFGLYNMVGNVWEWTSTRWEPRGAARPGEANAMVKKGGSFLCNPVTCNRFRCSSRMMFTADSAACNVGFRCAYAANSTARGQSTS